MSSLEPTDPVDDLEPLEGELDDEPDYNFEPTWLNTFLAELKNHRGEVKTTCRAIGKSSQLIYRYAARKPGFLEAFERERAAAQLPLIHELEDELVKLARSGDVETISRIVRDGQAPTTIKVTKRMREILLLLERISPDRWAPKPIVVDNSPRNVTFQFAMSDRELIDLPPGDITEHDDRHALPPGNEDSPQ